MTYPPCVMPSQARCERVPPAHHAAPDHWAADLTAHDDNLPLDPRTWCRDEVGAWVARGGGRPERFPMNGKALCLMSREMFVARVPGRGDTLHLDFRRRLAKALALQELIEKLSKSYQ